MPAISDMHVAGVSGLPSPECAEGRSVVNVNCCPTVQVLQKAVCPEKRRGMDTAESAIASVTEVRITSDLQVQRCIHYVLHQPFQSLQKLQGVLTS